MTLLKTTIASLGTLGLGMLGTVATLMQAGGFSALLNRFALLALIPYAFFAAPVFSPETAVAAQSPRSSFAL